jgi:hypothetical protein
MGLKENINRALKETHTFNAFYNNRVRAYVRIYAYDVESVKHLINEARNSAMSVQFETEEVLQLFDKHNMCGMIFAAIKGERDSKIYFFIMGAMHCKPIIPHKKSYYDEEKHMYYEPIHL